MDDLWNSPLTPTPQTVASSASTAPPPEQNGTQKRAITTLNCVESAKEGKRKRSPYWAHYDKILKDGQQKAICKYCSRLIGCDPKSGTSALKNHIERCKEYPLKSVLDRVPEQCSPVAAAAVVTWDMFPAARTVQQMMDTIERVTHDPFAYGSSTWPSVPAAESNGYRSGRTPWAIRESEMSYKIRFDMPGMTRNDVKVWVEENVLVVEAEKVPKRGQDYIVNSKDVEDDEWPMESYGKYNNRIALPETVHAEKIKAEVKDGVLYVNIPKTRVTNRKIEIDVQ